MQKIYKRLILKKKLNRQAELYPLGADGTGNPNSGTAGAGEPTPQTSLAHLKRTVLDTCPAHAGPSGLLLGRFATPRSCISRKSGNKMSYGKWDRNCGWIGSLSCKDLFVSWEMFHNVKQKYMLSWILDAHGRNHPMHEIYTWFVNVIGIHKIR